MTLPPDTPGTLIRNVLQGMVALLELHARARTLHVSRDYVGRWIAQLQEAVRLLEGDQWHQP